MNLQNPAHLFAQPLAMRAEDARSQMTYAMASMGGQNILPPRRTLNLPAAVLDQFRPFGEDSAPYHQLGPLAIIQIDGPMWYSASPWSAYCPGGSVSNLLRTLERAGADADRKAVVLSIDSPGGDHHPLSEIADAMRRLKAIKPVHAFISPRAYSQGYMAASLATEISAVESGACGSIGTISFLLDDSKHAEAHGMKWHAVTSGSHKAIGGPGQAIDDEQLAVMKSFIDHCAADFAKVVVEGRSAITTEMIEQWDGRTFYGHEMVENGLVDRIETEHAFYERLMDLHSGSSSPGTQHQTSSSSRNSNSNSTGKSSASNQSGTKPTNQRPGTGTGDHTMKIKNMTAEELITKMEEDDTVDNEVIEKVKSLAEDDEPENTEDHDKKDPENTEGDDKKDEPENKSANKSTNRVPQNSGGTPASFAELEDIVPQNLNNRDAVITTMMRKGTTVNSAHSFVNNELVTQLNAMNTKLDTNTKIEQETGNTGRGRQPLPGARGNGGGGGAGNATQAYDSAVKNCMKEHSIPEFEAVRKVRNEQPEIVNAWLGEINAPAAS